MRIEDAIRDHLAADAGVTAAGPGGIFQLLTPEHEERPCARVLLIDEPREYHLRGIGSVTRARLQIDVFAHESAAPDAYTAIGELAEAIDLALRPMPPFWTSGSPSMQVLFVRRVDRRPFDPDDQHYYRMMQDFEITFRQ